MRPARLVSPHEWKDSTTYICSVEFLLDYLRRFRDGQKVWVVQRGLALGPLEPLYRFPIYFAHAWLKGAPMKVCTVGEMRTKLDNLNANVEVHYTPTGIELQWAGATLGHLFRVPDAPAASDPAPKLPEDPNA